MHVLVVGAGIAGLTAALRADALGHDVELLVKGHLGDGCTVRAQGGIAGEYGPGDSPALHALDTMHAGNGHGDPVAIAALVDGAAAAIDALVDAGVRFDRAADGSIARGLEAAHSLPRIAHAGGDATGKAISDALIARLRSSTVQVSEGVFAADLLVEEGRVCGIRTLDGTEHRADAVVLATGGAGRLFPHTTNPPETTGDGIAMALRAGAAVADLEFMQFHPTVLAVGAPFLISEAVRGAGAVLRDADGRRFMLVEHPDAELAPRDVVARAVARRADEQGSPVLLDATSLGAADLARRFPTIDAELRRRGIEWAQTPVPITPAAHYLMGGVVTDIDGRTSLPGLWAVGETARSGVHGANRLASNSLLEGVVFGARVADALASSAFVSLELLGSGPKCSNLRDMNAEGGFSRDALQRVMWEQVGLRRTDAGLASAVATLDSWRAPQPRTPQPRTPQPRTPAEQEDANLLIVAHAMASAALARTDSLGAHFRVAAPVPALIGAP
ncbi:L-aspartate oxidase [Microbacterium suwonense]|uniref:L-aspartate oxidase n=1 Tax=Microbacterium suwonense TaxID=683047 RepID=A0ABN6X3V7_9MICO|nr:L-aspartate oxidase [Microbacterium suwonense]BDZ38880.1 L-aspartate oxidase [Microbacterium suwonense]